MSTLKIEIDVRTISKAEQTMSSFFDSVEKGANETAAAISRVEKSQNKATSASKNLTSSMNSLAGLFKTIKAAAIGYATVLATMEISAFARDMVSLGVELESLESSYTAITGSSAKMREEMTFLGKAAEDYGLDLKTLRDSYKEILASAKNTSLEGEGLHKLFIATSKAASVLGMSIDDTKGTLKAFSQMISKSNVQAEELIKSITYKICEFLLAPYTVMYSAKVS